MNKKVGEIGEIGRSSGSGECTLWYCAANNFLLGLRLFECCVFLILLLVILMYSCPSLEAYCLLHISTSTSQTFDAVTLGGMLEAYTYYIIATFSTTRNGNF